MTAELRAVGDKLALYTDDNSVYLRFSRGIVPIYKVPYFRNGRVVGYDLFFDAKQKTSVAQIMKGQLLLDM
ncbi:MAG: hypothetical protein HYX84_01325 [Chloroflexi bacterium]|nr:hypothetical protein [Chloroflexota bacterium]